MEISRKTVQLSLERCIGIDHVDNLQAGGKSLHEGGYSSRACDV